MEWIKLGFMLNQKPERGTIILVYCGRYWGYHVSFYDIDGMFTHPHYDFHSYVTHWMPLPKNPESEDPFFGAHIYICPYCGSKTLTNPCGHCGKRYEWKKIKSDNKP